jgi:hypothetical protein
MNFFAQIRFLGRPLNRAPIPLFGLRFFDSRPRMIIVVDIERLMTSQEMSLVEAAAT